MCWLTRPCSPAALPCCATICVLSQNILSYNLFSCSAPAARRLRLLYTYLSAKGCLSTQQERQPRYNSPAYDAAKHYEFNTDLKNLYVVVTRARSRLLVYEQDEEVNTTLQDFLQLCKSSQLSMCLDGSSPAGCSTGTSTSASGLVEVWPLAPGLLAFLQQENSNSADEWYKTGAELFAEAKFERAEVSTAGAKHREAWVGDQCHLGNYDSVDERGCHLLMSSKRMAQPVADKCASTCTAVSVVSFG